MGTTDAEDLAIYTDNIEHMRITEDGYVGIGTNSPISRLEVVDSSYKKIAFNRYYGYRTGGNINISRTSNGSYNCILSAIENGGGSAGDLALYVGAGGAEMRFIANAGTADGFGFYTGGGDGNGGSGIANPLRMNRPVNNLVMKITRFGNLGLGDLNPDARMEISANGGYD